MGGVRLSVLAALVLMAVAVSAAAAAEKPIAVASNTGGGTVTVSGGGASHWHVVVTTKPAGLPVLVHVAGRPHRTGKSPIVIDYGCSNCSTRVTASLSASVAKPVSPSATIKAALYRR